VHHHAGLAIIAVFKLLKGFLLLAAAIGLLNSVHSDLAASVQHWITLLRMDPDSHYFHLLLVKVGAISPEQIKAATIGSFFYSGLLLTEGVGLWFERRWAEYLTVIVTASFIPLELYELSKRISEVRVAVLAINVAILWYLIWTLRRDRKPKP
jgi:uncharacterized membrane protein (DUF2068 family)